MSVNEIKIKQSFELVDEIKYKIDHLQNIYVQAIGDRDEWVKKYVFLKEQYESYKLNAERKQAEKCQACRQGTK